MRTLVGFSLNFWAKTDKKADKNDKFDTLDRVIYMAINYGKIKYLKTCASTKDLPGEDLPEIVLAGRSNVGKSSLVNALGGNKKLARVSQTPGKTQQIIYFDMDGVLADFDRGIVELLGMTPKDQHVYDPRFDDRMFEPSVIIRISMLS